MKNTKVLFQSSLEFNGKNITKYHLIEATIYLGITLSHHLFLPLFSLSVMSDSAAPWTARSMPGLPVLHYLLEFAQTPVQWFGNAIQPPHSLSPLSPPALNLFQHQGLFQWVSSWHQAAKMFSFIINPSNEYSELNMLTLIYIWINKSLESIFKIYFNWRLITLQYCGDFCHTLTWISHWCTCVHLSWTPLPPPSLFHPSGLSHCTR